MKFLVLNLQDNMFQKLKRRFSLRRGAGVNVQDSNGYTPLHHACVRGHKEIARLLLAADASPGLVDSKGASPLHLAAWVGATDIVRMLLTHNSQPANVDLLTNEHETALLYAAQFGHVEVVALLLGYGADVTVRNNRGESALDLAAQYGKLEIVRHLLSARPQLVNPYRAPASRRLTFSHTPLHRASINGHRDVVAALLDAGVDPNVLTPNGTALHEAALCGKESVVSLLIQRGVKLNAKDHAGRTVAMLLSEFPEKATQRVREAILRSGPSSSRYYESEDDLPAIPVQDQSPYENSSNSMRIRRSPSELYDERRVSNASMKARETQKNTKLIDNKSTANTSLTKIHPQSFVKKLASKCLGLKAKFNSAPNISNSGIESEVTLKSKSSAQAHNTSTLLIGNSKFFKKLSRKDETGDMVCNDEFDTISLDRLGTLERESVVNRSNRSCPGFKVSLPNISENTELGDSRESLNSVIIVELDDISEMEIKNDLTEAVNEKIINNIFEPRNFCDIRSESPKIPLADSIHALNECYEPYEFSESSINKILKSNKPQPQPRHNLNQQNSINNNSLYENVILDNNIMKPKPVVRKKNNSFEDQSIYENFPTPKEETKPKLIPQPPKRNFLPVQIQNDVVNDNRVQTLSSCNTSRSTTPSSDSFADETNLEDVLLSKKSYSFKHTKKIGSLPLSVKSVLNKSDSVLSNSSDVTEISAMENVDCSEEIDNKLICNSVTGTLPSWKSMSFEKPKILFRHKTFTTVDADKDLSKIRDSLKWNNDFLTDTLKNYHIRGTGHCIYQGPTVKEFLHLFNTDNLYHKSGSFSKYLKRDSYYETAICFCKPMPPKHHNSAEDLLKMSSQSDDAEVTIDTHALLQTVEMSTTSFRCFCDDNLLCIFHTKKRESPNPLVIKFSAINKSISAPNICLQQTNVSLPKSKQLIKNKSFPKTENPYAVVDVTEIAARKVNHKSELSPIEKANDPFPSLRSTLSSTTERQYSIKDVAEVLSFTDDFSNLTDDASPMGALCDNSMLRVHKTPSSSGFPFHWQLGTNGSNSSKSEYNSFKSCFYESDSDNGTLHSDGDSSSDNGTLKSDVSATKRPWVDSDSFKFDNDTSSLPRDVIEEEQSDESPSECGSLRGDASEEVGEGSSLVASLERARGAAGAVRSGSGRRRWDELEATSEGDALSLSSAASSNAPHHMAHHYELSKVSPTPPKKPPRRNLSVSPTHANSPSSAYSYELRPHARSQDDLDDIQGAKHYLKHGRSVDQYVDGKLSYVEYEEHSPRAAPIPQPRPSLKHRVQPVAITTMCDDVVMKEQNPRRKLRRNNFTHQYENFEPVRVIESRRKYSRESLLDDTPTEGESRIPSSPTHYDQPPTPDHPPPSAKQAENSIHERIRPLSQEYKRRSVYCDRQTETETALLRAESAASLSSARTDRSGPDTGVEEYVTDVPFAGLFKGSTTTLDGIGVRPTPAERPRTLRKLKSVYDTPPAESPGPSPVPPAPTNGIEEIEPRRRSNTISSTQSADKSLAILSPFDEQEEWAKISEIMASIGTKMVRESVFVAELEQEFTTRLGLSCSDCSLSPSVTSNLGLWLSSLGLIDYEPIFIESGFDDIDFINGILDENDLREMGIDEAHRPKILESSKRLPLKIAEISTNLNNNNISKIQNQNESVEDWLKNINLEQYSETFRKHLYVDMDRVRRVWEVELTAVLEIQKAGHRKRILASVSGQQNGPINSIGDVNTDLNSLKNNIQQLKDDIKEKLPENLKPVPPPTVPTLAPPGGETLKRSKKNRPAPQPPRPSDLEIRAPSELLVGVPGALKTQWKHQPFVLVAGAVTYVANYLGSTVVKELRGTESTKKSIQKLKKSTKEPRDSPDIILSISYRGVKFLNTITRELICEHEIRNIHCACQDADDLTHFAYITKDHATRSHYCHVFCVATMDQATEVILTLGEAFEVAYQMALREQANRSKVQQIQAKTPTHDPMTTTVKEKPNMNHGRSHSITEIKLNGHQLKVAPIPASLSNEDFQVSSRSSEGSRSPRTPLLKAPIASTEEL